MVPVTGASSSCQCESGLGHSAWRYADTREGISQRIAESGPSSVWRHLSSVVASKKGGQRVLPSTPVDRLNEYFVNVGPAVSAELAALGPAPEIECRLPRVGTCAFDVEPITMEMLRCALFTMRNSAACGDDGICVRVLKLCAGPVGDVILHIVNSSLTNSQFPDPWKHSLLQPIYKAGDPNSPSNFRPISIIPPIAKLVERVVQRQLYHYLSHNSLLASTQHGFRPNHSTETALVTVTDRIMSATDNSEISVMCMIDLSKCFDVIEHATLLQKLRLHNISTSWFSAYLHGHTQSVSFSDSAGNRLTSKPLPNNMGVFQGSALGPLLFSVFANDLSLFAPDVEVVQYADDTQLLVSGKKGSLQGIIIRLETALNSLNVWFRANGLKVNAGKTQIIAFGGRHNIRNIPAFQVKFGNAVLTPCKEVNNLGVIFDPLLTWDSHVSSLSRRCFGILSGLSHLRHHIPSRALKTLVTALVLSHVRYCISIFGNGTKGNLDRLQKIINFAARVIAGRRKYDGISDVLCGLRWMTSAELYQYHLGRLIHKTLTCHEPESLACELKTNQTLRERHTRQDELLYVPWSNWDIGKRRFRSRAVSLYNGLPPDIKALPVNTFGAGLKGFIISNRKD